MGKASRTERFYRLLLRLCPRAFREEFGEETVRDFTRLAEDTEERKGAVGVVVLSLRAFFDVLTTACREHRRRPLDPLRQNLRDARRNAFANPGFTLVVVLTLALGIGANGAIFGLVYDALLRPLPFPEADKLVMLWETDLARGSDDDDVTPANFEDWRETSESFEDLAAVAQTSMNLTGDGEPERLTATRVSSSFFPVLGVGARFGRVFVPEEDQEGAPPVVVLTHGLWERRFGERQDVIQEDILLDGEPYRIVGVLPSWFHFPSRDNELFVPLAMDVEERSARSSHYLDVIGRLRDGVPIETAQREMEAIGVRLAEEYPDTNTDNGVIVKPLRAELVRDAQTPLLVLLGAVGAVLLIAVVNVANLLLARSASRQREVAVRAALGASRGRILAQLMTEAAVLAACGAALGLLLGHGASTWLRVLTPSHVTLEASLFEPASLVFAFALFIAVASGMGLLPALALSRSGHGPLLKDGASRGSSSRLGTRARSFLVTGEVALAVVLLVVSGLMLRSFQRLMSVSPGFQPESVLTMRVELSGAKYEEHHQKMSFYRELQDRVERLPGVISAGFVTMLPLTFQGGSIYFGIEDGTPEPPAEVEPVAVFRSVSPDYFRTLGIPLLRGRGFDDRDREDSPKVAIINETLAQRFFDENSAVGRHLDVWGDSTEIVGVAGDVQQLVFGGNKRPAIYVASAQRGLGYFDPKDFAVRTIGDPEALTASVRAEIWAIDPDQPIASIRTMNEIVAGSVADERLQTTLLSAFGLIALVLAALGIYGVLTYTVAQRTGEIGLRMALGARGRDVLGMVTGQGMVLALWGMAVGLVVALGISRFLSGMLYEIDPHDPWTLVAISCVLGLVALTACILPALRATRVDPLVALREE